VRDLGEGELGEGRRSKRGRSMEGIWRAGKRCEGVSTVAGNCS